jgi:ATP-dependent protease HslVU (ClpYQ) peptidase subunit
MTIVSAIVDGSVCIFMSDSGSFCEETVSLRSNGKLFKKYVEGAGECLLGFAGLFAIGQWIKHIDFPECIDSKTFEQYLVLVLQPFLMRSISKRWKRKDKEYVDVLDFTVLLGFQGCLYTLYSNGDVERAQAHEGMLCFASIGSGGEACNAAMFALQRYSALPKSWEILEAGLENAEQTTVHVKKPFITEILYSF